MQNLRWLGAQRILLALGIVEPIAPTLRAAMRGWVGYFDEMMIDQIFNADVDSEPLVELAVAALASTLLTVTLLDESVALSGAIMKELNTFATRSVVG